MKDTDQIVVKTLNKLDELPVHCVLERTAIMKAAIKKAYKQGRLDKAQLIESFKAAVSEASEQDTKRLDWVLRTGILPKNRVAVDAAMMEEQVAHASEAEKQRRVNQIGAMPRAASQR